MRLFKMMSPDLRTPGTRAGRCLQYDPQCVEACHTGGDSCHQGPAAAMCGARDDNDMASVRVLVVSSGDDHAHDRTLTTLSRPRNNRLNMTHIACCSIDIEEQLDRSAPIRPLR